jgi:hypothetical protein
MTASERPEASVSRGPRGSTGSLASTCLRGAPTAAAGICNECREARADKVFARRLAFLSALCLNISVQFWPKILRIGKYYIDNIVDTKISFILI